MQAVKVSKVIFCQRHHPLSIFHLHSQRSAKSVAWRLDLVLVLSLSKGSSRSKVRLLLQRHFPLSHLGLSQGIMARSFLPTCSMRCSLSRRRMVLKKGRPAMFSRIHERA
jgi:hypothetical protein